MFAKVMDMTTTVQTKRFIPNVKGVFVDIFPLDYSNGSNNSILQSKVLVQQAWKDYFKYDWHYSFADIEDSGFSMKFVLKAIKTNLKSNSYAKRKALDKALAAEKQISIANEDNLCHCYSVFGFYNKKDIFSSDWFKGYIEMPFEGLAIRIPIGYHDLLTHIYGDYMTPPPVDKRIHRHEPYYINLKERLTLQDIAKRVKAGENKVY